MALLSFISLFSVTQKFNYWIVKGILFWKNSNLTLKVIWTITILFLLLFIVFFFVLVFSRIIKNFEAKKEARLRMLFQSPFSTYLFDEAYKDLLIERDTEKVIQLFGKKNLERKKRRRILRKELISLHKSYSGEIAQHLEFLFLLLGFDQDVLFKLKSKRWNIRSSGINEAAQMNVAKLSSYILHQTNDKNPIIRIEAQVASVKLNSQDPFLFFGKLEYEISDWDQIQLHDALQSIKVEKIPCMDNFLDSKIDSIIIFALKIIGYYSQEAATDKVIKCLSHSNDKVKIQTIRTLGELESSDCLSVLMFELERNKSNKLILIETLKSIENIGILEENIGGIVSFLFKDDYDLIFYATRVLQTNPSGIKFLNQLINDVEVETSKIIKYAISFEN
jgi:hypothetical protein